MGWQIGFDTNWNRDIGYGVPAVCDKPDCAERINRGLAYVCGGEAYGGEDGCGLFFCLRDLHLDWEGKHPQQCERCCDGEPPFEPKPDIAEWLRWKLTDESWAEWREANPAEVERIKTALSGQHAKA